MSGYCYYSLSIVDNRMEEVGIIRPSMGSNGTISFGIHLDGTPFTLRTLLDVYVINLFPYLPQEKLLTAAKVICFTLAMCLAA